jgi:pimeloyl-ACP methyl ester carboxylesterase
LQQLFRRAGSVAFVRERFVAGVGVREWGDPEEPGILLWPGLGATGAYFAAICEALPGRAVAVDPPGFGRSAALAPCTYERLVGVAAAVADACDCRAMVGHSLGAYIAVGVATQPAAVRAVVLIDGGFLGASAMAALGMPATAGIGELTAWLQANAPRFANWETAIRELATMIGTAPTPAIAAYARELLTEVDGEIRDPSPPERLAELVLAVVRDDAPARAERIAVPTLLIACGQPADRRAVRENAWQPFADASPLIELHVADEWGHNPILQDQTASAALITDWVKQHL